MAQALAECPAEELGGPGWRIRVRPDTRDTVDPPPAPRPASKARSRARLASTIVFGVALFSATGGGAIALSPSTPAASAHPAIPQSHTPVRSTLPASPRALARPTRAQVNQAGREYVRAVAPLNNALDGFDAALHMANSLPCKCPAGEFDGGTAVAQIPGILQAYAAVQTALRHIKTNDVPVFSTAIAAAASEYQKQMASFTSAYQAYQNSDAAGVAASLQAVASEEAAAKPVINALRRDFALAPAS